MWRKIRSRKGFAKPLVNFRFYSEIKVGLRYPSGGSCAFLLSYISFSYRGHIMRDNNPSAGAERKQRRKRNFIVFRHSNLCLLIYAVIGWCFEYAWELGLGRHYLG